MRKKYKSSVFSKSESDKNGKGEKSSLYYCYLERKSDNNDDNIIQVDKYANDNIR